MKKLATILLLSIPVFAYSKSKNDIPRAIKKSPRALSIYLTQDVRGKRSKVDTIYSWITHNIDYDYKKFVSGNIFFYENTEDILKSGKATCTGYCNLLSEMLEAINVQSEIVYGYTRTELRDTFAWPIGSDHAWIAIRLEGEWHLADPTWDAGYIGGLPTNKKEKFDKKWAKLNGRFDKKEGVIENKAVQHPKKIKKFEAKLSRCKKRRSKRSVALKRKERNTKDFKNEQGFISHPSKANYLVSPDSFLVEHLPANPMWQLKKDTISISTFVRIGNTVESIEDDGIEGNYPFESKIKTYVSLDFFEKLEWAGADALVYNPKNHSSIALNTYNSLSLLMDKDFQEATDGEYEIEDYEELIDLTDTIKIHAKQALKLEKAEHKVVVKDFKKTNKLEKASFKSQTKLIDKAIKMHDDFVKEINKNLKKLETYGEKVYKIKMELSGVDKVNTLGGQYSEISSLTDSLDKIMSRFEQKEILWKAAHDTSYLQKIYDSLWHFAGMLNVKNYYLHVKNYNTYEYIEQIDLRVLNQVQYMKKMYQDSLPIEMLGSSFYKDVRELHAFLSYADYWLEKREGALKTKNLNHAKSYYKFRVLQICERYLGMLENAHEHNKWIKGNLKDFEKYWKDAEKYVKAQEELIERRNEVLLDIVETNYNRNRELLQEIRENADVMEEELEGYI